MSQRIHIRSVILCDDVRQEVTGKEILIGVYNDSMIFPSLPGSLKQLILRISCDLLDKDLKTAVISLRDPSGTKLSDQTIDLTTLPANEHPVFGFIIQGLVLYAAGTYSIELTTNASSTPEKISDFVVRTPQNDEERRRVPS
jgi:hypothetical protein